jgi:tetratricopeptide (TPR) repeat protein
MSRIFGTLLLAVFCLGLGCGVKKKGKSGLWKTIIKNGDALYLARNEAGELDRAIQWYLSGVREFPQQPQMKGRLSRAYVARAYGLGADGLDGYATAREFGLECMKIDASFGGLVSAAGGAVTPQAVAVLGPEFVECMTWTSIAWSRWLDERGVIGASIDLPAVKALARRAVELQPDYDGGLPSAALGLALALAPKPLKPKLKQARKAFEVAIAAAPERLSYRVDLAQYVVAAEGRQEEWVQLLEGVVDTIPAELDPDRLENARAIIRARALLAAGLDRRWILAKP